MIQYRFDEKSKTLYLRGDGTIEGYESSSLALSLRKPWDDYDIETVIIEEGITGIGEQSFSGFASLKSITIPNTVTEIGDLVFSECTSLSSITIPDSVKEIAPSSFSDCTSLTSFVVSHNNPNYCSIDGILFNKNKTTIIRYPPGKVITSYTLPKNITAIGSGAFSDCESLKSIIIPEGVVEIGEHAFSGCTSLYSITIPNSVKKIGEWAFGLCLSLHSITIPDSVEEIGNFAFSDCYSLSSIIIPDSVEEIGHSAFIRCENIEKITFSLQLTRLDLDGMCRFCDNLKIIEVGPYTNLINVPAGLKIIRRGDNQWHCL